MDWLQILGPYILIVLSAIISGIFTLYIKSRVEELNATKEKLKEEQRNIYSQILDPFIQIFVDLKGQGLSQAIQKIKSYEYRKTAFDLNLVGSDEVVRAYNILMQYTFKSEASAGKDPREMMRLWGSLLLEIRKSLGQRNTKLDEWDMLRGMIKDIDKH